MSIIGSVIQICLQFCIYINKEIDLELHNKTHTHTHTHDVIDLFALETTKQWTPTILLICLLLGTKRHSNTRYF